MSVLDRLKRSMLRSAGKSYAVAVAAVGAAIAGRLALNPVLGPDHSPLALLCVAIIFVAWYGGWKPGLLALLGGAAAADFFLIAPRGSLAVAAPEYRFALALLLILGLPTLAMIESLRRGRPFSPAARRRLKVELAARQAAEHESRLSAERFRMAAEAVGGIIYEYDPRTGVVQRARGLYEVLGYHPEEVPATVEWWSEQIHPEDLARLPAQFDDAADRIRQEYRVRHRDGHWLHVEDRAVVARDANGAPIRMVGCTIDVTDRKRVEANLAFLARLSESLASLTERHEIAEAAAEQIVLHFDVSRVNFSEVDPLGEAATVYASRRQQGLKDDRITHRLTEFLDENTLAELRLGHVVAIDDVTLDQRTVALAHNYQTWDVGSLLLSPHVSEGQWRFLIVLHKPHAYAWQRDEIELISEATARNFLRLERADAERALRESESHLRHTVELNPQTPWTSGPDGRVESFSTRWLQMTGRTHEETVGHGWLRSVVDEDLARVKAELARAGRDGDKYEVRYRIRMADGSIRWMHSRAFPRRDAAGRVLRWYGMTEDVHEQQLALDALTASEARFRSMANATPAIIWTADARGIITFHNDRWLEYTGISAAENAADWPRLVLHPDDYERCIAAWTRALETGAEYEIEVRNRRHDGEYRWFLTRATPIRDAHGDVVEWYGSTTDIHDRKLAEQALRDADRSKDEFLATLAHELRNPLAPIVNALSLVQFAPQDTELVAEAHATMQRQVAQMVRLVDDLLDVGRIARNRLQLRKEQVALADVVAQAVDAVRPACERDGHRLHLTLPPQPICVEADPARLAQVIGNLLTNACKYTPPGGDIWLSAATVEGQLEIRVRDSGVGIPPEMLAKVFDLFTQVERSLERSDGGLGIGLSLVRRLVELHGGTVAAHSEGEGCGSEFILRLPCLVDSAATPLPNTPPPSAATPPAPHVALRSPGRRVLVVDDNRDAATTLAMLVESLGGETRVAHDGVQAVELAAEWSPEVILLDLGLPRMNGYEACRAIRQQSGGDQIAIYALTGWGQEADRRQSAEAGFTGHFVKPIEFSALVQLLTESSPSPQLGRSAATIGG